MKTRSRASCSTSLLSSLLAAATMIFCVGHAGATELLANGNFNDPSSGSAPTGWTSWTWGDNAWANYENDPTKTFDGSYYLNCGNNWYNGGAGFYQTIAGAPGIEYTLSVESGADAWWQPTGRMSLFFLDSSGTNVLLEVTTNTVNPPDYGYTNDIPHPWSNYTMVATSPSGTALIKVEFASAMPDGIGGSVWFDNASLTAPINPPVIANVYPDGNTLLQATNKLTFTATSAMPIDASGVQVVLDGVDVSSNLVITGVGTTNVSVSYTGLPPDQSHTAVITVTDTANLTSYDTVNFDTYTPLFSWEAEDYDYNSGQYINSPILSSTPVTGSYFGVVGVEGVDYHDYSGDGSFIYRSSDTMDTEVTGDKPRQKFINAGVSDYQIGYFDGATFGGNNVGLSSYDAGEWLNYTRDFPAGTYNIIGRLAYGNGGTASIPLSRVTSGWGTTSQTSTNLGTFKFPSQGWGNFEFVPLTDRFGNRVKVTLSGTNTLRVTAGTGGNLNFFMLVPVDKDQPTITDVYPDGRTLLQGTNTMTFTVSSASHAIPQTNVIVTLNGMPQNDLTFSGNSSSWHVSLPLSLNVLNYTAVISVTDDAGNSHSLTIYFDTFTPSDYTFEAEDFDFNGGQYIDNTIITSVAAPDSYFDQTSVSGVDSWYGDVLTPLTAPFRMRQYDIISTDVCSDTPTRALLAAQRTNALAFNYNIAYWSTNAWLNYTHNYPAGNFRVYARLAGGTGLTNQVQLDLITNSTTAYLGTFTDVGRGYNFFDWIPLMNTNNGQPVTLTLGGLATLRTTSMTGNVNPNSYLLVPAVTAPIPLQYNYSAGVVTLSWADSLFHLQAKTNSLSAGLTGGTWGNYPGGASSPVTVKLDNTQGAVFFRLSN